MYLIAPPIFMHITTLLNEVMIERTFFKLPSCKLVASILAVTTKFLLC